MKCFEYCYNPKCKSDDALDIDADNRTKLTPRTVLYKCEMAGATSQYIQAPRYLSNTWAKKVISPLPGYRRAKINTGTVYCPKCYAPLHLNRDVLRVAVAGPTNCGKTVYLTVLNQLLAGMSDAKVSFVKEVDSEGFEFDVEVRATETRYKFPNPTQVESVNYIRYEVSEGAGEDFFSETKTAYDKNATLTGRNLDMLLYDIAGEWFGKEQASNRERDLKIAHLFNADLVLFMIDCEQVAEDAGITLKTSRKSKDWYVRTLTNAIKEIKDKSGKDPYFAFCFLSVDSIYNRPDTENIPVQYADLRDGNILPTFYDKATGVFHYAKYMEQARKMQHAFGTFFNGVASLRREGVIETDKTGFFAISSIGHNKIVKEGDNKYIHNFNSGENWGVTDPLMWFLSCKKYIRQE